MSIRKDPAMAGYAHGNVLIRPWIATVDGKDLVDSRGRVRRFSTPSAALAASRRAEVGR